MNIFWYLRKVIVLLEGFKCVSITFWGVHVWLNYAWLYQQCIKFTPFLKIGGGLKSRDMHNWNEMDLFHFRHGFDLKYGNNNSFKFYK